MEEKAQGEVDAISPGNNVPRRFILVFLSFCGLLTLFALRLNLSVAIVAMVITEPTLNATDNGECANVRNISFQDQKVGEFSWKPETQSFVLGGFFYGYLIAQFPGGIIAQRLSGKWTFGFGLLIMSILTLLTPVVTRQHVYGLVTLRALLGFSSGIAYPAIHVVLAKWSPSPERSRISALVFAGSPLGGVVSQVVAGLLADSGFLGGWPSVFYVMGLFGCGLSVLWIIVISESPEEHPNVSQQELDYIQKTAKPISKKLRTPWRSVFTSMAFWAMLVSRVCSLWGQNTLRAYLPRYIEQVLHVSINEAGALSALPYLVCWVFIVAVGFVADFLRKKRMSTRAVRKLTNTIGMIVPAVFLVAVTYTGCDVTVSVLFLTLAVGFTGFGYSGFFVNHFDIAPRYAGPLFGVCNSVASITGFISPYVVGIIMSEKQTVEQWRVVFFVCAGIYVFGAVFYLTFAQGHVQPWAVDNTETKIKSAVDIADEVSERPQQNGHIRVNTISTRL